MKKKKRKYVVGEQFTDERFTFEVIGFDASGLRISKRIGITEDLEDEDEEEDCLEETEVAVPKEIVKTELTIKQMQEILAKAGKKKESKYRLKADLIRECNKL